MKPLDLSYAVVVITGGARGIGLATAQAFATLGATVYSGDLTSQPDTPPTTYPATHPLTGTATDADTATAGSPHTTSPTAHAAPHPTASASHLAASSPHHADSSSDSTDPFEPAGRIHGPWLLDVTSRESFASFVDNVIADAGRIDVLVNNAGVMPLGWFLDEPDALSRTTLDVNVWGLIHGMRLVLPGMIARGNGHVVNIASMAGKIPFPGMAVYNASKYAAVGLTAAVRRELHGTGVTASAVLPSAVRTSLSSGVRLGGVMPTVDPSDVAAAVLRTCRTRQAEVTVPRWLAGWKVLDGLVPSSVMALGRRLAGDDRGLAVDDAARAAYVDRVASFSQMREV
ncbi:SDR family oxidoreductase [Kribbella sp. NPDC049174]|uniref:SDR family oxidoreductase n=1 Tax=Kribbella sp. NPDC049174 TaxID=3364112 RepID=UPI003710870F